MLTQARPVDDSRSVLNFRKRHIETEGLVEATTFLDPVETLACARERTFDPVLVDYERPHMDGISFIRTLRTLPQQKSEATLSPFMSGLTGSRPDPDRAPDFAATV